MYGLKFYQSYWKSVDISHWLHIESVSISSPTVYIMRFYEPLPILIFRLEESRTFFFLSFFYSPYQITHVYIQSKMWEDTEC